MPPRKKEPLGVATLEDIGRLILHSHDLDETLRNVAELVARRAGTEVCSIYLMAETARRSCCAPATVWRRRRSGRSA